MGAVLRPGEAGILGASRLLKDFGLLCVTTLAQFRLSTLNVLQVVVSKLVLGQRDVGLALVLQGLDKLGAKRVLLLVLHLEVVQLA